MRTGWFLRGLYLVFSALLLVAGSMRYPAHNWDMIPYVATVYQHGGLTGADLLSTTYADVRQATSEATFRVLVEGPYRQAVATDPALLERQLPFYAIRPLYIASLRAAALVTPTVSDATVLVSALAGGIILSVSALLLWRAPPLVFVVLPVAMVLVNILSISRGSTPDALAAALAILAVGFIPRWPRGALVILPLLPAVRTDFVLLVPLLAVVLWPILPRWQVAASALGGIAIYAAILALVPHYGYLETFNFTLIHGPTIEALPVSRDPEDYFRAYLHGLRTLVEGKEFWQIAGAALVLIAAREKVPATLWRPALAAALFMALHFLLFPSGFFRTYFFATWAAAMVTLSFFSTPLAVAQRR